MGRKRPCRDVSAASGSSRTGGRASGSDRAAEQSANARGIVARARAGTSNTPTTTASVDCASAFEVRRGRAKRCTATHSRKSSGTRRETQSASKRQ